MALTKRLHFVHRVVRDFAANFDDVSHLTRRRSRRSSRGPWIGFYDQRLERLQQERIAVLHLQHIHSVGVRLLSFVSEPIRSPRAPIV